MEELFAVLIFSLPGILTFWLIQMFGVSPSVKKEGIEYTTITAMLWIPITFFALIPYVLYGAWVKRKILITNISDLVDLANNPLFLIYFVIMTVLVSFIIARFYVSEIHPFLLNKINETRENNNIAPFSKHSTVWNETFLKNEPMTIQLILSNGEKIIGLVSKAPRESEGTRDLVVNENMEFLEGNIKWSTFIKDNNISVERNFIDGNSGSLVRIYNNAEVEEALQHYTFKE